MASCRIRPRRGGIRPQRGEERLLWSLGFELDEPTDLSLDGLYSAL
jgi:hypothetical protein